MKKLKGSLTVEAAIVLPMFLMAILSVVYIVKIIFIHESIQYALSETANEMATYAYLLEKTEILNAEQEIYHTAMEKVSQTSGHADNISQYSESFYKTIEGARSYGKTQRMKPSKSFEDMKENASLGEYIKAYIEHAKDIKDTMFIQAETAFYSINEIITSTEVILNSMESTLINACLAEGMEVTNNFVGTKMAELFMEQYISEEQLDKWFVIGGRKGLDYKRSRFMLADDDIDLIVYYDLSIPIPFPVIDKIPIMQRVKVRGFTGNGNSDQVYVKPEAVSNDEGKDERIVYVVEGRTVYHLYRRCVQKISYPLDYVPKLHKSRLCKTCSKRVDISTIQTVYHIPSEKDTNGYHVIPFCSTHYSKKVYEITLNEVGEKLVCEKCAGLKEDLVKK